MADQRRNHPIRVPHSASDKGGWSMKLSTVLYFNVDIENTLSFTFAPSLRLPWRCDKS
jgi:hypothetical protein